MDDEEHAREGTPRDDLREARRSLMRSGNSAIGVVSWLLYAVVETLMAVTKWLDHRREEIDARIELGSDEALHEMIDEEEDD